MEIASENKPNFHCIGSLLSVGKCPAQSFVTIKVKTNRYNTEFKRSLNYIKQWVNSN